jgi:hypothetical protein
MPTAPAAVKETEREEAVAARARRPARPALWRRALPRELLVFLGFCLMTALLTWPYVTRLRDAVADPGDPYLVAWILWWDYHATFTDPLNLFHANVFYPYRYTLAFSEHCYGIALPFFPLFALGFRPLSVHAFAMFIGFAACGYGAFRLGRTLTGSAGAGWVAGIVFAFVPYRFHLVSHLPYLFSPWIPLLFEALVLFVHRRSRRRAAWLGVAFFMTGLTTVTWFALSLVPAALAAAVLLTRRRLWGDQDFWRRGAAALGAACLALLPFMLPYYIASQLYGFERSIREIKLQSAWPIHWLSAEGNNRFWRGFGEHVMEGMRFKLFPGLLPVLLSLAAVALVDPPRAAAPRRAETAARKRLLAALDAFILLALVASVFAVGYEGTQAFGGLFNYVTSERALAALTAAAVARLCLSYPALLRRGEGANLIETLRSPRRTEAFWLGLLWFGVGFCYSLGWNFFFYRILYQLIPIFKSMRVPTRGAMIAYLGLSVLAGLGVGRLAELVARKRPGWRPAAVYAAACVLLLAELNAAPLHFMRGEVFPDAVTLRLKETPMRGGIVVLPANGDFNHRYMLRAADHAKPLVVGTSGFNPPYEDEIERLTREGPSSEQFLDLLEKIPASYLVIHHPGVPPEQRAVYETFLSRAIAAGRLRFVNRFDGRDDLYAVVKTEPEARSEAPLPFEGVGRDWATLLEADPVNLLGANQPWSSRLYHVHFVATGRMPRYAEFLADARELGRGFRPSLDEETALERGFREFVAGWTRRPAFRASLGSLSDEQYVARLFENAGVEAAPSERAALVEELAAGRAGRADVLLRLAEDPRFTERERWRALVLLHFFGYLRRNPDDPPDGNLDGMLHWIGHMEQTSDPSRLPLAFMNSLEYKALKGER